MSRARILQTTRDRIVALRERGWTHVAIGREVGLSKGAVAYHLLMAGAEPPTLARRLELRRDTFLRRGRPVHSFTAEEDALVLALRCQDYGATEIARVLTRRWPDRPRSGTTVLFRLHMLARHDACAEAAP